MGGGYESDTIHNCRRLWLKRQRDSERNRRKFLLRGGLKVECLAFLICGPEIRWMFRQINSEWDIGKGGKTWSAKKKYLRSDLVFSENDEKTGKGKTEPFSCACKDRQIGKERERGGGDPTSPTDAVNQSKPLRTPHLSPSHIDCMVHYLTVDCMCRRKKTPGSPLTAEISSKSSQRQVKAVEMPMQMAQC